MVVLLKELKFSLKINKNYSNILPCTNNRAKNIKLEKKYINKVTKQFHDKTNTKTCLKGQ